MTPGDVEQDPGPDGDPAPSPSPASVPLLRDPPPPPGWVDPLEGLEPRADPEQAGNESS